jgi:hypothetical protein
MAKRKKPNGRDAITLQLLADLRRPSVSHTRRCEIERILSRRGYA